MCEMCDGDATVADVKIVSLSDPKHYVRGHICQRCLDRLCRFMKWDSPVPQEPDPQIPDIFDSVE